MSKMRLTLQQRLLMCAQKAGTKKEFAQRVGLSHSQLFRYLRGEIEPPLSFLQTVSDTFSINMIWLTTGAGTPETPFSPYAFDADLLRRIMKVTEEAILELPYSFTFEQKSILLPYIYLAACEDKNNGSLHSKPDSSTILRLIDYVAQIKNISDLELLFETPALFHTSHMQKTQTPTINIIVNLLCEMRLRWFNTPAAKRYFERVSPPLNAANRKCLQDMIQLIFQTLGKKAPHKLKLLDIGCGNARHLAYQHSTWPEIELHGIEAAEYPFMLCQQLERKGSLPPETVLKADYRDIPFPPDSFDIIQAFAVLQQVPYLRESTEGLHHVLQEIKRVLKPGGLLYLRTRTTSVEQGLWEHLRFEQTLSQKDMHDIAAHHNMEVIHTQKGDYMTIDEEEKLPPTLRATPAYREFIEALLRLQ